MHTQSALLSVIAKLTTQLAITQRQYDQEKAKADKSKTKLADLKENINSATANIKQIEDLLIEVFNGCAFHFVFFSCVNDNLFFVVFQSPPSHS
jgi:septal ring factor EnvC (AmiA/AmiB activator)